MFASLVFALTPCTAVLAPEAQPSDPNALSTSQNPDVAEFEKRRKAADKDTDKLWDLYDWCQQKKLAAQGKSCLRRIVQLKPDDEKAHKLLGDVSFDGKWFPSEKKVEEYKKQQAEKAAKDEEKAAKEKGLVKFKDQWVSPADLPNLQKGLVKNERGEWVDPEEQKKLAEGWVRQDLEWIAPAEKENIAKNLWKCGEQWLDLDKANEFHSELFQWWRIPHESKYVLATTCDRKVAETIDKNLSYAWDDLVKCYGFTPPSIPTVLVLRAQAQYESYAAGDQEEGRPPSETHGLSSVHYAFLADLGFDPVANDFVQFGVGYWDASTETGPKWGIHATRHALGLSFAEVVDPSPKAIEKARKDQRFPAKEFWEEKKLPSWFRYGAAVYAERYYVDLSVGVGGNSRWAIEWSIQNLLARGGMLPVQQVLDFEPENDKAEETQIWFNRVGLLMHFMVDGKCAPVTAKLTAVQEALKTGKDKKAVGEAFKALGAELAKHETDLRKFAGL